MCLGAAALGSLASLKFIPAAFIGIGLCGAAAGLAIAALGQPMALRLTGLLIGALGLALGAVEAGLSLAGIPQGTPDKDYQPRPYVNDSIVGWRPVPGQVTHVISRLGDSILYDVRYSVDSLGHRVGYPDSGRAGPACVAFLICSFSFGEGVQDSETLPYRVGARTAGRVRTVNLGVPGYGAEHMLAALERASLGLPCAPTHIVYQALPHHVVRAAQRVPFSKHGPRYRLEPDGSVVYSGTTPPPDPALTQRGVAFELDWQMRKSRLYRLLRRRPEPRGSLDDLRLYLAIVRRSRALFAERYPGAEFHVLAWSLRGFFAGGYDGFRDSLRLIAPTHEVQDILPHYAAHPEQYELDKWDAHPNPRAYDLLAGFVVDSIVKVR